MKDEEYMQLALDLAKKGCGQVNPNPMVGAVIVQNGKIIAQGWHQKYGALHAERQALATCETSVKGATLYVTLEPCCHFGKTPPCTDAIITSKIKRVVTGSTDPNPLVGGKGTQRLKSHGIQVTEGVLKDKCDKLNEVFFHFIQKKTPYVVMKYAMTMDGKMATYTGASKWITGAAAQQRVHEDRHRYSGIMVGVGTILADNPELTCRLPQGRNPIRIICDTQLRTPLQARVITSAKQVRTILATSCPNRKQHQPYVDAGCEIIVTAPKENQLNLIALMQKLGALNIDSILLEGGSALNGSALQCGMINKVQAYIAPKLFGGSQAKSPIGGMGIKHPNQAVKLTEPVITQLGSDLLLESEVITCLQEL